MAYVHTDPLGSPVARSNGSRQVIERTQYEPYGRTVGGSTVPTGVGFTGHVNDADTGLVYMQQRYCEPVAGRFLSVDPVVTDVKTGSSFNRYVYGNNNPYKFIDPDGRSAVTKFVKQTIRHEGNVIQAAIDVGGDIITVFSPASTPWDRVEAAISLVSPIDVSDVKAAKSMLEAAGIGGGGRKRGLDTRALNAAIGDKITSRGGNVEGGFGGKESQFGTGRGSRYSDGSATDKSGNRFEVQTVDTKAGGSLTEREVSAARDIAQKSNGPVVCVSKDSCR